MDNIQNIVVVGGKGKNPAKLRTQLEPVKLDIDMEMAITSLSHGEIYNIHNENNKIYVSKVEFGISIDTNPRPYTVTERFELEIPTGTYKNVFTILKKIVGIIKNNISPTVNPLSNKSSKNVVSITTGNKERTATLELADIIIHVEGKSDSPWEFLRVKEDIIPSTSIEVENVDLLVGIERAFLYVNIVENSYINGKKSRNLSLIPLSKQKGIAYHEFTNPNYIPVEFKQFSEIFLEIRNMDGEYVRFNSNYNTVITLHMKPINRTRKYDL